VHKKSEKNDSLISYSHFFFITENTLLSAKCMLDTLETGYTLQDKKDSGTTNNSNKMQLFKLPRT
jgi:hypothetical protein